MSGSSIHHAPPPASADRGGAGENGRIGIRGRFLGDVIALVPSESGVVRWSDERAKPFERKTLAALAPGARAGQCPRPWAQILENRTRLNRPDGYWSSAAAVGRP